MANNDFSAGLTKEELNIIFLLDTSGSMSGARISQLNCAMPEALAALREAAMKQEMRVIVRVAEFNNFAEWIMGRTEKGLEIDEAEEQWKDLTAKAAGTNTAAAILLACDVMHTCYLGTRNYHPYVILITDGESNNVADTNKAIDKLKAALRSSRNPARNKVERIAIGVVEANRTELENFASRGTIIHDDQSVEENVPLVFNVDDVSQLSGVLKSVAVSSLISAAGDDADGDNGTVIETVTNGDDGDWED